MMITMHFSDSFTGFGPDLVCKAVKSWQGSYFSRKHEGFTVWMVNNVFFYFQALAQIWGCAFVEASAKHRTNVNEVFAEIVREMNLKHSTKDREIVCECCCM